MVIEHLPAPRALHTRRQWLVFGAVSLVLVLGAHLLDEPAWRLLRDPRIYEKDIGRLFRVVGFLPTWLIVAGAVWLHDRGEYAAGRESGPGWGWRGGLVLLAPTLGGTAAELLKLLIRRLRPMPDHFEYVFRPFADGPLSNRGMGMPSSHALVAFAGAAALARVFPRSWWIWYVLATGCAVTRIMAVGHFLSDTVVAACVGYAIGVLLSQSGAFGRATSPARAALVRTAHVRTAHVRTEHVPRSTE